MDIPESLDLTVLPSLDELYEKASAAEACEEALNALCHASSVEELLQEKHLHQIASWVLWYAQEVLHGRFREAECLLLLSPYSAMMYAETVIEGRWPEAEKLLLHSAWKKRYEHLCCAERTAC